MLRSMNAQLKYRVTARDGSAGSLDDFLIDDGTWMVRYALVNTGDWLPGRQVLIGPDAIESTDGEKEMIALNTTRNEIESAPDLDADKPVSRQYEHYLHEHYRWAPYWIPGFAGGTVAPIVQEQLASGDRERLDEAVEHGDPHLRSLREITGYELIAGGDPVGAVAEFMCYDDTWEIPFLVADVGGWFHKELLMIPTSYVGEISFTDRQLAVNMSAEALEDLPTYDPHAAGAGRLEMCIYDYRGKLVGHKPVEDQIERN